MKNGSVLSRRDLVGTPGRIRTCDLLLRRQTLYPSELQAHVVFFNSLADGRGLSSASAVAVTRARLGVIHHAHQPRASALGIPGFHPSSSPTAWARAGRAGLLEVSSFPIARLFPNWMNILHRHLDVSMPHRDQDFNRRTQQSDQAPSGGRVRTREASRREPSPCAAPRSRTTDALWRHWLGSTLGLCEDRLGRFCKGQPPRHQD